MAERNAGLQREHRIEFRIGIHLGDVVEESDGDLMGDPPRSGAVGRLGLCAATARRRQCIDAAAPVVDRTASLHRVRFLVLEKFQPHRSDDLGISFEDVWVDAPLP
jgi:hypothetical protein